MVRNLVFDLGNVLVEFKPKDYMTRLGFSSDDTKALFQIIFKDKRWGEFDRGTLKIEEYSTALAIEHPEYKEQINQMFSGDWAANFLKPKLESIAFLKEVSAHYRIYILSNVSEYVLNYVKTLGFWEHVSGGTYSYMVQQLKPEPEIYETFFKDNGVVPEECLFLDDLPQNIAASEKAGMKGIVFHDNLDDVRAALRTC